MNNIGFVKEMINATDKMNKAWLDALEKAKSSKSKKKKQAA